MAPIEILFGSLLIVFAVIGLVRGFLRELGVTTVMLIVLLALHLLEPLLEQGLARVLGSSADATQSARVASGQTWFFGLVILIAAFISYAGETLTFRGERLGGVLGLVLGLLTGAINGYLIVGSLWYYLDRWDYALGFLGLTTEGLSTTAQNAVQYLPLNLLGQPLLLGQSWLLYLAVLLLIGRVIR
ncbi:MAG: hypothetical protein R6X16_01080 [Anaerolineae bacterium]